MLDSPKKAAAMIPKWRVRHWAAVEEEVCIVELRRVDCGEGAMQWAARAVEVLCIDAMGSFSGGDAMQCAARAVEVLCIDAMGSFSGGGAMQGEDSMEIERPVGEGLCSRWG